MAMRGENEVRSPVCPLPLRQGDFSCPPTPPGQEITAPTTKDIAKLHPERQPRARTSPPWPGDQLNQPYIMLDEFKKFILKGNMIDLAVGVIIGGAFGKVVEKFTECIMSVIGKILSLAGMDESVTNFDTWAPGKIKIGAVITQTINLVLVGFALFLFIKAYNKWLIKPAPASTAPPAPPEPSATEKLLTEIRDSLKR